MINITMGCVVWHKHFTSKGTVLSVELTTHSWTYSGCMAGSISC